MNHYWGSLDEEYARGVAEEALRIKAAKKVAVRVIARRLGRSAIAVAQKLYDMGFRWSNHSRRKPKATEGATGSAPTALEDKGGEG